MDGLNEVFSDMKIDPKLSVGNLLTIAVLLFHLVFYSAKGISDVEQSVFDVKKNAEDISEIELTIVAHQKDLEHIKKQLFRIEMLVTKIAEKE